MTCSSGRGIRADVYYSPGVKTHKPKTTELGRWNIEGQADRDDHRADRAASGKQQRLYELKLVLERRRRADLASGKGGTGGKDWPCVLLRLVGPQILAGETAQPRGS
ncbi:hypothetical protein PG991_008267 [Apiospora marii]|uniref:Uncharacterized protein n=1 Tax=Apiospora marii TaxID=335849 RepID=A0ABR1RQE4_9PEZI